MTQATDWQTEQDEREKQYREEGYRHTALGLAVKTTAAVLGTGTDVAHGETLRIADVYAAYLRDGTRPEM